MKKSAVSFTKKFEALTSKPCFNSCKYQATLHQKETNHHQQRTWKSSKLHVKKPSSKMEVMETSSTSHCPTSAFETRHELRTSTSLYRPTSAFGTRYELRNQHLLLSGSAFRHTAFLLPSVITLSPLAIFFCCQRHVHSSTCRSICSLYCIFDIASNDFL